MLYNVNRDPEKDPRGLDWDDFFTEWKEPMPDQTDDEMYEAMMGWTIATKHLPSDGGVVQST